MLVRDTEVSNENNYVNILPVAEDYSSCTMQ